MGRNPGEWAGKVEKGGGGGGGGVPTTEGRSTDEEMDRKAEATVKLLRFQGRKRSC